MLSAELNILLARSHGIPDKKPSEGRTTVFLLSTGGETEAQTGRGSPSQETGGQTFDLSAQTPYGFLSESLETIHPLYKQFPARS